MEKEPTETDDALEATLKDAEAKPVPKVLLSSLLFSLSSLSCIPFVVVSGCLCRSLCMSVVVCIFVFVRVRVRVRGRVVVSVCLCLALSIFVSIVFVLVSVFVSFSLALSLFVVAFVALSLQGSLCFQGYGNPWFSVISYSVVSCRVVSCLK